MLAVLLVVEAMVKPNILQQLHLQGVGPQQQHQPGQNIVGTQEATL